MEDEAGPSKTTVKIEIRGNQDGENEWDDRAHSTVRRLQIYHRDWICSIQVEYDRNGQPFWRSKHGGNEGSLSDVVLDYPNEYLISIYGYYGHIGRSGNRLDVIRSLTLQSNRKSYGPFGKEEGTKFSFPIIGAKIVGFHGKCGSYIDAIGLYIQPISKRELSSLSLGPWGGKGGKSWERVFRSIRRLVISHQLWIHTIEMQYEDEYGKLDWSKKHGSRDGSFKSEVVLEFPDEHFVSLDGYYGDIHAWGIAATVIRSLTLKTNKRTYGPFGVEEGTKFSLPILETDIVGVHGRSGWYLDAIGLYLGTKQKIKAAPATQIQVQPKHSSFVHGGTGGDPWEYTFCTMRQFVIYHGQWIDSIQMEYENENGIPTWSDKHGGNGGSRSEVVLEFPNEYLVSIHGYQSSWSPTLIRSLTLETNKKSYGPFGVEDGTKFSFPTDGIKIVGIHGRSGRYLDAIGLHVVSIQE